MVADTERGLLLTCLWYIREVDPQTLLLTGLTRDGVYLVEDGEVVGAVNNFRFNECPVDLLGRVTEVGRTERDACRASGATTSPARRCRRCGSPTSTCPRSARPPRSLTDRDGHDRDQDHDDKRDEHVPMRLSRDATRDVTAQVLRANADPMCLEHQSLRLEQARCRAASSSSAVQSAKALSSPGLVSMNAGTLALRAVASSGPSSLQLMSTIRPQFRGDHAVAAPATRAVTA